MQKSDALKLEALNACADLVAADPLGHGLPAAFAALVASGAWDRANDADRLRMWEPMARYVTMIEGLRHHGRPMIHAAPPDPLPWQIRHRGTREPDILQRLAKSRILSRGQ
jgi:hypothetical protein